MFKKYGEEIKTADGIIILRLSRIVSYCLSGNHGSLQTQMQPPEDIWRTAVVFEAERKFKIFCTKWNFCFHPHPDGGYEHIPKDGIPIPLDSESSGLIKNLVLQYREMKENC